MRRGPVGLEGGFVFVQLVEDEAGRVLHVLRYVEILAAGLVGEGTCSVFLDGREEFVKAFLVDVEFDDQGDHEWFHWLSDAVAVAGGSSVPVSDPSLVKLSQVCSVMAIPRCEVNAAFLSSSSPGKNISWTPVALGTDLTSLISRMRRSSKAARGIIQSTSMVISRWPQPLLR